MKINKEQIRCKNANVAMTKTKKKRKKTRGQTHTLYNKTSIYTVID